MALGDLVKSLVVRFSSDGWEKVKAEIDDIPDKKTVDIVYDRSGFSAALADLATLGRSMDSLERSLGGGGGGRDGPGFLSRLLYGGFTGIGPVPAFFTSLPGLAVAAAGVGGVLTIIDQLVSGFAAAGQGAVAFGALAYPTFTAVSGAITNLATDTAAYQAATTSAAKSTALAKIKADWAALDPVQKTAVKDVLALQNQFDTLATKFEAMLKPIINTVLGKNGIVSQIIQDLPPFANAFAQALEPLLVQFNKFLNSPGAAAFQKAMLGIEKLAIPAIGHGIGQVASQIGRLLTIFSAKDDARAIQIFFDVLAYGIRLVADVIQWSKTAWDWLTQQAIPKVIHAFDNVRHAFDNVRHAWDNVSHAIDNFNHALDNIGHAIGNVIHAFGNIVHAIGNVIHAIENVNHAIDNVRHFIAVETVDIWHAFVWLGNQINHFFTSDIPHWISVGISWFHRLPGMIISAVGNLGNLLVNAGRSIIQGLIAGINAAIPGLMSILHWVTSLIPSWKGPIDKDRMLLYPSGQAIMGGLMSGIGSQVPALHGQLSGITRGIGSYGPRGYGPAGSGQVVINFNGIVGDPHKTAMEIQQMLLQLKRRRFGVQGNTAAGLGLA